METPAISRRLTNAIRLPVDRLRIGMYVADLDCGWSRTPFPLEGLQVSSSEDLATVRQVAKEVTVDPHRSDPSAFQDDELAAMTQNVDVRGIVAGSLPAQQHPAPPSVSDEPLNQFISKVYGDQSIVGRPSFRERLAAWWQEQAALFARRAGMPVSRPMPSSARPSYVPRDIDLVVYRPPEPLPESLPQAKQAHCQAEAAVAQIGSLNRVAAAVVSDAADSLVDNMILRPATMMWVTKLRARDAARYQQAVRVAVHLTALGRQIGFQKEQLADLASIGLLLDVGKMRMPVELLERKGPLEAAEADILRGHVRAGLDMLAESHQLAPAVIQAIGEHHERLDGTGYPSGLLGSEISLYGKMAAIVDAYVAMTNPRPYAPTLTPYDAIRELFRDVNTGLFGPLVEQFVQAVGIFPVGSLVELSTGEAAIVVQHNLIRRLEPKVLVLTRDDKRILDEPWELDLLRHNASAPDLVHIVKGLTEGTYGIDFRNFYVNRATAGA